MRRAWNNKIEIITNEITNSVLFEKNLPHNLVQPSHFCSNWTKIFICDLQRSLDKLTRTILYIKITLFVNQ